jgi:hypothetical protein
MSCRVLHVTATGSAGSGLSVLSSTATVPACATAAEILAFVFAAEKGGATPKDRRLMLFIQQEHFPLRPCAAAQVIKATQGMVAVAYPAAVMSETRDAGYSVSRAPPPPKRATALFDDSDDESFGASKPTVQVPQKGRHPPSRK